ncbi:MAG: ATP-binding protein [Rubrivivax sp.]|nr:ATP-binding protein [Rubrivivax sp.]
MDALKRPDEQFYEALSRTNNELVNVQRELARANAELSVAKQRAEQADRLKSAFLATMSHELRTPLNSIIGFSGILRQRLTGPLNDEQDKQLGMVQGSARHLLALINDVLDISKIEAGELLVDCAPFDLDASIAKSLGIVAPLAAQKGLALRTAIAPLRGRAVGDVRRVEQVLLNLLGNAIKFTEHGEVALQVTPCPAGVQICVSDTGMGIRPDDLASLFLPFRQLDASPARSHEGTGLGLAICQRLAKLMGGEVAVESVWGRGSSFTLTLPREGTRP